MKISWNLLKKMSLGVLVATAAGFFSHVALVTKAVAISKQVDLSNVMQLPYPLWITVTAFLTMLVPVGTLALVFWYLYDRLPAKTAFGKGTLFWLLIVLIKGELFRNPLMSFLVRVPVKIVLLQHFDPLISNFLACLVLAYTIGWIRVRNA